MFKNGLKIGLTEFKQKNALKYVMFYKGKYNSSTNVHERV